MHRNGFDPKRLSDAREAIIEIYLALAPVETGASKEGK
jgi:hypothetical protein